MSITVICTTKGRDTLRRMAASFLSQSEPDDLLWIIGDGLRPRISGKRIRVEERPKSAHYGHCHRVDAAKHVETTHFTFLDDDDMYLPGTICDVRKALSAYALLTGFCIRDEPQTVLLGINTNRPVPGGWQMWFPRGADLMDFSNVSDAEMVRQYLQKYPVMCRLDLRPLCFRPDGGPPT